MIRRIGGGLLVLGAAAYAAPAAVALADLYAWTLLGSQVSTVDWSGARPLGAAAFAVAAALTGALAFMEPRR